MLCQVCLHLGPYGVSRCELLGLVAWSFLELVVTKLVQVVLSMVNATPRQVRRPVGWTLLILLLTASCSAAPTSGDIDSDTSSTSVESRFLLALAANFTTPSSEFCELRHFSGSIRQHLERPPVAMQQQQQQQQQQKQQQKQQQQQHGRRRSAGSIPQAEECATEASVPRTFEKAYGEAIRRSLSPWAGCPAMTLAELRRHFETGAPWCRAQVCLVSGELHVLAFSRSKDGDGKLGVEYLGAERQHAALLGLAELLELTPQLREISVCVTFNCQDRPAAHGRNDPPEPRSPMRSPRRNGSKAMPSKLAAAAAAAAASATTTGAAPSAWCKWRPESPPLLLSYMTSLDHWDVPWPDYLFWGLDAPQKKKAVADWATVRASVLRAADEQLPYASRPREMLYCSKLMHTDEIRNPDRGMRGFYHAYMPLREAFTARCLETCGGLLTRPPPQQQQQQLQQQQQQQQQQQLQQQERQQQARRRTAARGAAAAVDAVGAANVAAHGYAEAEADADADAGEFDLEYQPDRAFLALRQYHPELWRRTWARGWQFTYKCQYRSLLILQGRSAWLDHLKMELACGSLVLFATDRTRPTGDRMDGHPEPAQSFFSHLLTPGEHFVHLDADHASPTMLAAEGGSADTGTAGGGGSGGGALSTVLPARLRQSIIRGGSKRLPAAVASPRLPSHMAPLPPEAIASGSADLCAAVDTVRRWARENPAKAACIGAKGKEVVRRWLTMDAVRRYMARSLVAIAALQDGRALEAAIGRSPWFVRPRLSPCVRRAAELREARSRGASTEAMEKDGALACVARAVAAAVAAGNETAFLEARSPLKERDRWLVSRGPRG